MVKKVNITIGVVAHNEEKNIGRFLNSVLSQKQKSFIIQRIMIVSDGSTDGTVEVVKSIKSKRLKIIERKKRLGKSTRLNQIYKSLSNKILVQFDADVILGNAFVLENIIQPIIKDNRVAMCGGNPIPKPGKTLIERAISITCEAYNEFRKNVTCGDNVFSADGRILALRKELVKKICIPADMIANDMYVYFSCLSLGYSYRFVERAIVNYSNPKTIADHIKQNTRFRASPMRMKNYFQKRLVENELTIPKKIYLSTHFKYFMKNPFLSLFIFFLNRYCEMKAIFQEKKLNSLWDIAYSTKELNSKSP